jgi:tRNA threonylcarbamoyl adenosine modification protein (Sua5/YciO/YrdC/YwlC family)
MTARVLRVDQRRPDPEVCDEAARVWRAGGLVAFPTETVYGVGVRESDHTARERLRHVKGRPETKPFTAHLAATADIAHLRPPMTHTARRLADRYWPGPLTLVFAKFGPEGLGVRVVDHPVAQGLIERLGEPVRATSANLHGLPPARDAMEVRRYLGDRIDLIIDGGPAKHAESSTVVAVSDFAFRILRPGVLGEDALHRAAAHSVVFICTGNICRSAAAEAMTRAIAEEKANAELGPTWRSTLTVASMGTGATDGVAPPPETIAAAAEVVPASEPLLREHRARRLDIAGLTAFADIYGMADEHLRAVRAAGGDAARRIRLVDPQDRSVDDPYGDDIDVHRRVTGQILDALEVQLFRAVR